MSRRDSRSSYCTQELTQYGGRLAYRVRFAAADGEYCYTIAARTGEILDVDVQRVHVGGRDAYHITFTANGKPYSFYVDAHDGDIF